MPVLALLRKLNTPPTMITTTTMTITVINM
jgi:hypothetical protein